MVDKGSTKHIKAQIFPDVKSRFTQYKVRKNAYPFLSLQVSVEINRQTG